MTLLDFEGDYGRTYDARIGTLIPAYQAIFELAAATAAVLQPHALQALVVGAGTGTELPGLLAAMPQAQFTLVEPSAQMRSFCQALIERVGATERVVWGPDDLSAMPTTDNGCFNAVVSHNVLHVLAPNAQEQLLRQMADQLAPGGCLLVSSYSEAEPPALELGMAIGGARLRALGMDPTTIEAVMASRNTKVFSMDPARLEHQLTRSGLEPPIQLVQALFSRLWLSRRCEGGASA